MENAKSLNEAKNGFRNEITAAWDDLSLPTQTARVNVCAGVIGRAATYIQIASTSPALWTIDVGQLVLRSVAETKILFTWMRLKGNEESFEAFINYGLGQFKLQTERMREHANREGGVSESIEELLSSREKFQASLKMPDFTVVDVGSVFGRSIRDLAKEADLADFYGLVYQPASSVVHGTWDSMMAYNTSQCENPLHKRHRRPNVDMPPVFVYNLENTLEICFELVTSALQELECSEQRLASISTWFDKIVESVDKIFEERTSENSC